MLVMKRPFLIFVKHDTQSIGFSATVPMMAPPGEAVIREAFGCDVEMVIPPPSDAVHGDSPMRNAHLEHIKTHGRMAWQKSTGYTERSGVETQIGRYKSVIGSKLHRRKLESQQTETAIGVKSLNRMIRIGRAAYARAWFGPMVSSMSL